MSRTKQPLEQIWEKQPGHISRLILLELTLYAKDKQFYPLQNVLLRMMTKPRYNRKTHKYESARYPEIKRHAFDYWFGRLVDEGYIEIDGESRSIRCVNLIITDKEDSALPE